MRIVLSEKISDLTIGNYVTRVLEKEWDGLSEEEAEEEFQTLRFYPDFLDLPKQVRHWLAENNLTPELIFEDREPLKLEFSDQTQALLYQMRWG